MTEKLDILVVEDKPEHQKSARILLGNEHNLTFASDFTEFVKKIKGTYMDMSVSYYVNGREVKGEETLNPEFPNPPKFNVVLSDLNFPFEQYEKEGALGYSVGLVSAMALIPYVGIVTDLNHHQGPIAAAFDYLKISGPNWTSSRPVFRMNNTKFMLFDADDFHARDKPKKWNLALERLLKA